jgi:hypothetical protein
MDSTTAVAVAGIIAGPLGIVLGSAATYLITRATLRDTQAFERERLRIELQDRKREAERASIRDARAKRVSSIYELLDNIARHRNAYSLHDSVVGIAMSQFQLSQEAAEEAATKLIKRASLSEIMANIVEAAAVGSTLPAELSTTLMSVLNVSQAVASAPAQAMVPGLILRLQAALENYCAGSDLE